MEQAGGDYFTAQENPDPDDDLRIFCEQVDAEQAERDKELFEFLEELIGSEEFRPKKDTKDASTQVLPLYLEKYAKETKELVRALVDDYSLTKYYQKRNAEENLKSVKLRLCESKKIRVWQDEAITIIKEHIYRAARQHACHLKERIAYKLNKIEKALGGVAYRPELKKKAMDYVLSMKKIKRNQTIGRKGREAAIVKKLLAEQRRWKQIQALQNKTYDYKVERRERQAVVDEIVEEPSMVSGLGICNDYYEEVPPLEEYIPVDMIKEKVEKSPAKQKKDKKGKKEKKGKTEKKDRKEKGEKQKKKPKKDKKKQKKGSKKGKKDKKKKSLPDLVLPEVPITNPREKIKPNDPELMLDIIRQHEELLMVVDEKRKLDEMCDEEEISYEKDATCFWRPNPVLFDNFQNGKCYKKHVAIINGGTRVKKIKLYSAIIDDGFDPFLICVDKFGIAVVIPGLSFNITLTFRPRQLNRVTYGKLTFVSYEANKDCRMQFSIPIKCVPYIKRVFIAPMHINFGNFYFWELKNIKPKRLRVISTDTKLYRVAFKKILEESEMENISRSISAPSLMNILQFLKEITEMCHHNFKLSRYFSELHPNSGFEIKIIFENADHIGGYHERYECQFFEVTEEEITFVGCQECLVSAVISGHFIDITPDILDFGVCSFGSVYQERFNIVNNDGASHRVLLHFPSCLKPYLSSNMAEIIITSYSTREISLKFMPREDMIDGLLSCYDPETKILKFPVKAQITTRDYENVPPIKLTIYAILTENLGLSVRPLNLEFAKRNGDDFLLDLGPCLTREIIYAKMGITNSTSAQQHYGFLDLPSCVTISPNYGFGYLDPYESRELLLQFSPENVDLSNCPTTVDKSSLSFRISVTTLKSVGAVKKAFNYKRLRRAFDSVMVILRSDVRDSLVEDMVDCLEALRNAEGLVNAQKTSTFSTENFKTSQEDNSEAEGNVSSLLAMSSFVKENRNFDQINTNKIWILSQVVDPPLSLSHQLVIFPNTPCGSFSMMRLQLKTSKYLKDVQCLCGYNSFKTHERPEEFEAHFEVCGDNPEITIEPICGDVISGNCVDLYLTAKPEVPQQIVEEKARYIKMMEIIAEKRKQILLKRETERQARLLKEQKAREAKAKKRKKESKKDKKKKGKKDGKRSRTTADTETKTESEQKPLEREPEEEPLPEIIVNEREIHINYFDLYPAEMVIWKDFQPKYIEANFTVEVTYLGKNINKPKDFLYLRAVCKVIRPSFIHNLDRQHLDFGVTAIGCSKRMLLELQNIRDGVIRPRLSLLASDSVFICPSVTEVPLPAEHVLRVPLTFKPINETESLYNLFTMTKFLNHAPFGVQTKRFSPIGFHPGLDPSGSMQAYKNKVSPCEYDPEPHECAYKKYNKTGSLWKRKADCEEFAANLGFRNHKILEQRKELRSMGGPGCYDISEYVYKKQSHSVLENVNFGHEVKFFQFKDVNPAPGTYTRDVTKSCVERKQLTYKPPFEWDGFVDRFRVPSKSWSKPPNLYNPVDTKSFEGLLSKVVSKKGPYNLFTGPRDNSTIKNHFAPPKKCAPDKYYSWPNGLDYLLHHPSKRQHGAFLKDTRFRKKTTERMLMNDLTTCYRDPNEPSPATYSVQIDSIKKLEPTMYPFNDSVPITRKGVLWTIRPGPGRYNVQYPRCKRVKTQSWVFKSNTGRSEFKPMMYSVIEYLDVRCGHTVFTLMLTGTGVQPSITFKPDFLVCRLQANQGSSVEVTLEIQNSCQANVGIVFEKILELKGEMKEKPPPTPTDEKEETPQGKKGDKKRDTSKGSKKGKDSKAKDTKKGSKKSKSSKSKSSKSSKGKKGKKGKIKFEKFGAQLNEDEIYSLENFYEKHWGASFFKVSETKFDINPQSKKSVKLCFGIIEEPQEKEAAVKKKGKKEKKDKKNKKGSSKDSKKSSKSSKKGKGKKGKKDKDLHYYIAKYNILLGNCTFVKDIIIIGNFS